eukprot:3569402-Rhodomonas_salina.1
MKLVVTTKVLIRLKALGWSALVSYASISAPIAMPVVVRSRVVPAYSALGIRQVYPAMQSKSVMKVILFTNITRTS